MDTKSMIERIGSTVENVPARAEVLALRQPSLDQTSRRAKRFLVSTGERCGVQVERGDWVVQDDRTLVRMPLGARAVIYHASGAIKLVAGLNPMESLFKKGQDRDRSVKLVEETAERLGVHQWAGRNESLRFERLWQIKAAAADPKGKTVEPTLCRVVGAYRHFVGEIPVWGPASAAIKVAGDGALDSLTIQIRETTGEIVDRVKILRPEQAARQILLQLSGLMGNAKALMGELAWPSWMRFGYLSLPKRKAQRLLAPVYIAAIETRGGEEHQSYLFAVNASEIAFLPLCLTGAEPVSALLRRTA
jgi:hypothetical protein